MKERSADILIAGSPVLPLGVILITPPRSPILDSNLAVIPYVDRFEAGPTVGGEPTNINTVPDLMDFESTNLYEPIAGNGVPSFPDLSELIIDSNLSNWNVDPDWLDLRISPRACCMTIIDRYSKLLNPSPWFQFADWLIPKLESFFQPRSSPSDISHHSYEAGSVDLPVALRAAMGLSKVLPAESRKATQFLSGVIPERFQGELTAKIYNFGNPTQAQIQAAELILSLLANNHKLDFRRHMITQSFESGS